MKVALAAIGKFHHFHLARSLYQKGTLKVIHCGYPWSSLANEQLPKDFVKPFSWIQSPLMASRRLGILSSSGRLTRELEWLAIRSFGKHVGRWVRKNVDVSNFLVALSGSGLEAGTVLKQNDGLFVCDRGSTHIRFQDAILREEYGIWNLPYNGIDSRIIEREEREYELADKITVPSAFNVRSFAAMGVSAKKVERIPYGANTNRFFPAIRPNLDKFVVLYVGQISLRKGIPYLLEAFEQFKHPRKELWVVGMPVDGMQDIMRRFPSDKIKWLGRVANTRLPELYQKSHVFVLPSVEEGLAMVQGESLASGCPVIATAHTGAEDLFTDGQEGYIVPIRSSKSILECLERMADCPYLLDEMSNACVERVKTIGGWKQYGDDYHRFLSELEASKNDTSRPSSAGRKDFLVH